jgi:hypothetical protein
MRMKMKIFFATILLSGILVNTGCQKVKSLLDVKFDANYTVNMDMTVPPASGTIKTVQSSFEGSASIDPTSNSEVQKYIHLIKSWHVTGLTGTFKNVTKEAVLESGTLTFSGDGHTATWTFKNVSIKNGGTFSMENTNGQWDELDQILSSKKKFNITIQGKTDIDDFSFRMSIEIKSTITANPLGSK